MVSLPIKLKKALILIGAFLYFGLEVQSQTPGTGTWNVLTGRYNIDKRWHVFAELQLRSQQTYHHFNYYEVKGGLGYNFLPNLSGLIGTGRYVTHPVDQDFGRPVLQTEQRVWQQLIYNQKMHSIRIEHRLRAEQRYTSAGYRNRFRYRINFIVPINKKQIGDNTLFMSTSNEFHFNNDGVFYEQNRLYWGLGYQFNRSWSFQSGWMYRIDYFKNNRAQYKNYIQASLQFTLNAKKSIAPRVVGSVD